MDYLCKELQQKISYRSEKIADLFGKSGRAYERLADISRHVELLTANLRASLIDCHNELQLLGYRPNEILISDMPNVSVDVGEKSVCIVVDGMLPFPIKGSVYYLHEKLDAAIGQYMRDKTLPRPLFDERCAVVFSHCYGSTRRELRHMRDYDSLDRRCITNVIARHFMLGDSPACYISMDILAPGETNHTEIRIMTIPDFRKFVMSENIDFSVTGAVSKNTPKLYQKE